MPLFHSFILFNHGKTSEEEGPFSSCSLVFYLMFFLQNGVLSLYLNSLKKSPAATVFTGFFLLLLLFFTYFLLVSENTGKILINEWFQATYCLLLVSREHSKFWKLLFVLIFTGFIINSPFKCLSTHYDLDSQRTPNASKGSAASSF